MVDFIELGRHVEDQIHAVSGLQVHAEISSSPAASAEVLRVIAGPDLEKRRFKPVEVVLKYRKLIRIAHGCSSCVDAAASLLIANCGLQRVADHGKRRSVRSPPRLA